jgi:hypothetical protein
MNFSISSVTNFVLSRADLLLSSAMLSGMCKKGIFYTFSMTSIMYSFAPISVFSYDLKSAYHHLQIFPADRMYLGFQWENRYYVYNVLPFGLATSGYIFSKVTREIVNYWRGKGFKIIMYLDDGLGGATCTSYESNIEKHYSTVVFLNQTS